MSTLTPAAEAFKVARDFLLAHRQDYQRAYQGFRWPELAEFNWALDWFDPLARGKRQIRAVDRRAGRCAVVAEFRRDGSAW